MLKIDAERLKRNPPRLGEGEVMPHAPVYWLIWILDAETKRPYNSRMTHEKCRTPVEAAELAYGVPPTENMLFWNMSPRVGEMRKKLRVLSAKWREAGGK